MKFDFVIGNPPYQEEKEDNGRQPSIYDKFMEVAYEMADKVELVTPARFLFNAGNTPKVWNEKLLNDPHFKVLEYEADSSKVFKNTDVKGGVAITYRDKEKNFGAIKVFTPYKELNNILKKVNKKLNKSISEIMIGAVPYRFTDVLKQEIPESVNLVGASFDLRTNIFLKLPQIFYDEKPNDNREYIQILGRENNERVYKYLRKDYVNKVSNLYKYKVILPKSNGSGAIGEVSSTPLIGEPLIGKPLIGVTQSFIMIGAFDSLSETQSALKYVKSKFARALLGVLKVTQDNPPEKWRFVPLQDFTDKSDIDWTKSIHDIDRQLYKKKKPNLANQPHYRYFH